MKSRRGGTILILFGTMLALLVALIVFNVTRQASAETKIESMDVVVAIKPIPERSIIAAEALGIRKMPVDAVPGGAVPRMTEASGKMTTTPIYPGEIILASKLADTKGQSGMSYVLDKGNVLVTFPASDIIGTGAVRVGDSVDILVTMKAPSQTGTTSQGPQADALPSTTQLTMQNLKVVSIGTQATANKSTGQAQPAGSNLITFALDHQDALMLKALKDGDGLTLEIVLRAAGDDAIVTTQPVTVRSIIERYHLR